MTVLPAGGHVVPRWPGEGIVPDANTSFLVACRPRLEALATGADPPKDQNLPNMSTIPSRRSAQPRLH